MSQKNKINFIFKIVEAITFICFCILAGTFMKDVIDQFQAKETFMGQSLKPINRMPTIVICMGLDSFQNWEYGKDVRIHYIIIKNYQRKEYVLKDHERNVLEGEIDNETVIVEKVSSRCFKINSSITSTPRRASKRDIGIYFTRQKKKRIPTIKAFFTSENNSYGIFRHEWYDGEAYEVPIKKQHYATIILKPVEYSYLEKESECSHQSYLEQWKKSFILKTNFSKCSKRCTPFKFLASKDIPTCHWNESKDELFCYKTALLENHIQFKDFFQRPCNILEYVGRKTLESETNLPDERKWGFKNSENLKFWLRFLAGKWLRIWEKGT